LRDPAAYPVDIGKDLAATTESVQADLESRYLDA